MDQLSIRILIKKQEVRVAASFFMGNIPAIKSQPLICNRPYKALNGWKVSSFFNLKK